eukprot:6709935-Prymnesium_polylepis.1
MGAGVRVGAAPCRGLVGVKHARDGLLIERLRGSHMGGSHIRGRTGVARARGRSHRVLRLVPY